MMDTLVTTLKALAEKDVNLSHVAAVLEKHVPRPAAQSSEKKGYKELVEAYHQTQIASKTSKSKTSKQLSSTSKQYFSLNFAKFEQVLKGLKKKTTNIQVVGFCDDDTYKDVLEKAAVGLGMSTDTTQCTLVCSGGVVREARICGNQWSLGLYIKYNGGTSNRSKKVWGLLVEDTDDDDEPFFESHLGKSVRGDERETYLDIATKRTKVGTSPTSPVCLDSVSEVLELDPAKVIAKYCPVNASIVCTSVIGVGLTGVWRLFDLEYRKSKDDLTSDILQETTFQPEVQGFYLIEIQHGSDCLLKLVGPPGQLIKTDDTVFSVNAKKTATTSQRQVLNENVKYATLLVLSPEHGKTSYEWARRMDSMSIWETLVLPSRTCILYVKDPGLYRCTFGDCFEVIILSVELSGRKRKHEDSTFVEMKDIVFDTIIGRGSFGVVRKGKLNGQEVALKCINLPYSTSLPTSNLPEEVEILRKLKHPNIVSFLGYSLTQDELILITNYVEGSNLDRLLFGKNAVEISEEQTIVIARKIAGAVHYMHTQNPIVIHQDLKPQNVLMSADLNGVYICDLGIAKVKMVAETTMTSISKGPGTYPFMAPEMFKKARRGPAVDIYSLGCLFIELFGKKRVWEGLDAPEIMVVLLGSYGTPPRMPDVSHLKSPFKEFCAQMCLIDPKMRPLSGVVVQMLKS